MKEIELSIILPIFNEDNSIDEVINKLLLLPVLKEIIVVDDGSTDRTNAILKKKKDNNTVRVIEHQRNLGKGAAVRTGIREAQGRFMIIQDGDLEQRTEDIINMLKTAQEKGLDAVFGSRISNWGFRLNIRYIANRLFTLLLNILFKSHLTDIMSGYKLCGTEIMKELDLSSNGFDIEPEIAAKLLKRGVEIHEIPIYYNPRTKAEGKKIRFHDSFKIIGRLLSEKL